MHNPGQVARYRLWCRFLGWQWPLRDGDFLEVRALIPTEPIVASLPTALLEAIIAHHLDTLALQATMGKAVGTAPARRPLAKRTDPIFDRASRDALRAKRRSRRPSSPSG